MKQIRRLQGEYSGMEEKNINIQDKNKKVSNINLKVLTFPEFSKTNMVSHLFSTKTGGCSRGIFRAMNLGFNLGDTGENVIENHRRIAEVLGTEIEKVVRPCENHTSNVEVITEDIFRDKMLKGAPTEPFDYGVDGMVTNIPGIAISVFASDCVPIFFLDTEKKAIGICHSGWKGTAKRIGGNTVAKMIETFGSNPSDIICGIGPCICRACYEISVDVADVFKDEFGKKSVEILDDKGNGKYQLDLKLTNKIILQEAGIKSENIFVGDVCTCCNSEMLFSHRATDGRRGNNGGFIMLKK